MEKITSFQYSLKILAYIVFIIITYVITNYSYRRSNRSITLQSHNSSYINFRNNKQRIGWLAIIFLSALIGLYSNIYSKYPYTSDRGNYAIRFVNQWDDPWTPGLNLLADFLHIFTNEPKVLFFTVSFLCLFVTLIAYRIFDEAEPQALLLMSMSTYCIYSFYLLKQGPSIAFAAISLAALFKKKWLLSIALLIIAITFHEAALILIPLYIVLLGAKKRLMRIFEYIVLILSVIFFSVASSVATEFIRQWLPNLTEQVSGYVDEGGNIVQSFNFLTILKGFPYYVITFYGLWKRPLLKDKIKNYDRFLVLSTFASAVIIMSAYMYWIWRFAAYCYFPMFIFASLILRESAGKERQIFYLLVGGTLFLFTIRYLFQMFFLYGGF